MELGSIETLTTKKMDVNASYELALKQQSYTANSLEGCVNLALNSIPNSAFLRNAKINSKGKNITVVADIWITSKGKAQKNPDLNVDKYKKLFKAGMKVSWDHPKYGKGKGTIAKISGNLVLLKDVVDVSGKSIDSVKLPLSVLKMPKR